MTNWIKYLLEANFYLALFYAAYYLLLRRDTHYQLNRAYLLVTTILSFTIPLLQLGILRPVPEYIEPISRSAQQNIPIDLSAYPIIINHGLTKPHAEPVNYYLLVYIGVGIIMSLSLIIRIIQLIRLARKGCIERTEDVNIVTLDDDDHAFSFFNYLFISKKLISSGVILQHELVHIRQKHSIDIIYIELLKIICWFNPAVYLLQRSMKELHEYIADNQIASAKDDVDSYTDLLISNAYGLNQITITNNFFSQNLLKNRIMMLHQKRSGSLARLKYLVAFPLMGGMLCLSTLGFTKDYKVYDLAPVKPVIKKSGATPTTPELAVADVQQTKKDTLLVPPKPKVDQVRFPPPMVVKTVYLDLRDFMQKNTAYPQAAVDKKLGGSVTLSFNLDASGKIVDVKVVKSIGSGLDEEGIRLLKAYNKPIADKAGPHTIALNFVTKGIRFYERASSKTLKAPGFVGEVLIYSKNYPMFPPPVVKPDPAKKSAANKVSIRGIGDNSMLEPTSPLYIVDGVRITKDNIRDFGYKDNMPEQTFLSLVPQEDIAAMEILTNGDATAEYGADGKNGVIMITTHKGNAKADNTPKKIDEAMLDDLYKYIAKTTRYPSAARENNVSGKVFIVFNVNDNNKVTNYRILRGLTDEVNAEAVRALKSWTAPEGFPKDVNFTIPLSFTLATEAGIMPSSTTQFENKAIEPEYVKNDFKQYSLNEVVIRGYVRRSR